jgi:hypothetical protein
VGSTRDEFFTTDLDSPVKKATRAKTPPHCAPAKLTFAPQALD